MQGVNDNKVVAGCGLTRSCALPAHPKPAAFAIATAMKRTFSIKVNTSFHVWLSFQLQFVYAGKESLAVVVYHEMLAVSVVRWAAESAYELGRRLASGKF